jgi:hypothetical protein
MATVGFLVITVSGIVAFIMPHGRIAYWTNWRLLGLSKTNWNDIHILGSLLFLGAICFHIYFNWKPLVNYFVGKAGRLPNLKREIALSLVVGFLFVMSAILHLPPISYVLDLNNYVKESWIINKDYDPPFGHAELLSFDTFCKKLDIPLDKAKSRLEAKRIKITSSRESLAEIAKNNGITPMKLYSLIEHLEPAIAPPAVVSALTPEAVEEKFAGSGIGRKSLSEIAGLMNMDLTEIQARLKALKIEVKAGEPLRKAARRNGLSPLNLLKAGLVDGYNPRR